MKPTNRDTGDLSHKTMDEARMFGAFAPRRGGHILARAFLTASLSLAVVSIFQTASAAPVTNVFTGITDLSFFGGNGADEIRVTYTFDTGLVAQGATVGSSRYGPITGSVRVDSLGASGFNFDFDSSNLQTSLLVVLDDATLFPSTTPVDVFSINFATNSNFLFGDELITGFRLTLIDEQATVFSSPALESGTGFFAEIDAINLQFNDPVFLDPFGFPLPSTSAGPGLLLVSRSGASLTSVSAVPLPAALPLFSAGLAVFGFFGWRKKRKAAITA